MSGAIPWAMMSDAERCAHAHDTGEDGQLDLYVPTAAGIAHLGAHLGVEPPRPYDNFAGDHGDAAQAGESTGTDYSPEGRKRPEGDARRVPIRGAGLLARLLRHDDLLIAVLGLNQMARLRREATGARS